MNCSQTRSSSLAGAVIDSTAGFGRECGEVSERVGDQNARPFAGANEQLTGRSDPLCFLFPDCKYNTHLAQEFVKSLSWTLTGSSWGWLR